MAMHGVNVAIFDLMQNCLPLPVYTYRIEEAGLWSRSRRLGLETYQRLVLVSSREKLSMSQSRPLRLVLKINFRPNYAGHISKTSQFWAPQECFTFTAASAGAFCIHSRWVSKSSVDRYSYYCSSC